MEFNVDNIIYVGVISILFVSGIMGLVFLNYIKKVLANLEDVNQIKPLVDKVALLVEKVEKVFITLEITKETHTLEISMIKEQIKDIYDRLNKAGM